MIISALTEKIPPCQRNFTTDLWERVVNGSVGSLDGTLSFLEEKLYICGILL
jgi:hypothetical protein